MAEIVVQNETFKIKGSTPTAKEQVAIDSVLAAKGNTKGGGLGFADFTFRQPRYSGRKPGCRGAGCRSGPVRV